MNMDLITSAAIGTLGWVGILAKNYYTQMASLRVKEAEQAQINEQRRIEKQEGYFERLFSIFTQVIGEEKDERLAFQHEMERIGRLLYDSSSGIRDDMRELKNDISSIANRVESACSSTNQL